MQGDLAIVSDRGRDRVRTFLIGRARSEPLQDVTAPDAPLVFSADLDEVEDQATAYGLAGRSSAAPGGAWRKATGR